MQRIPKTILKKFVQMAKKIILHKTDPNDKKKLPNASLEATNGYRMLHLKAWNNHVYQEKMTSRYMCDDKLPQANFNFRVQVLENVIKKLDNKNPGQTFELFQSSEKCWGLRDSDEPKRQMMFTVSLKDFCEIEMPEVYQDYLTFRMKQSHFQSALKVSSLCIGDDPSRESLNHLFFRVLCDGAVHFMSTNGHRLVNLYRPSVIVGEIPINQQYPVDFCIPRNTAIALDMALKSVKETYVEVRYYKDDGETGKVDIRVDFESRHHVFGFQVAKLMRAQYGPRVLYQGHYTNDWPTHPHTYHISNKDFLDAIQTINDISGYQEPGGVFIKFMRHSIGFQDYHELYEVEHEASRLTNGEYHTPLRMGINRYYLMDILKCYPKNSDMRVSALGEKMPLFLSPFNTAYDEDKIVVMPMLL